MLNTDYKKRTISIVGAKDMADIFGRLTIHLDKGMVAPFEDESNQYLIFFFGRR